MIEITKTKVFNFDGAFRGLRNPLDSWELSDSLYEVISDDDYITDWLEDAASKLTNLYKEFFEEKKTYTMSEEEYEEIFKHLLEQMDTEVKMTCNVSSLGPKDLDLAQRMIAGGTDESKFMRQILVCMDIEAPLYWWKEFDTYKVGTVANSCSTMHKLCSKPITADSFSFDDDPKFPITCLDTDDYLTVKEIFEAQAKMCEFLRDKYNQYIDNSKNAETSEMKDMWFKKAKAIWRVLVQILPNAWVQKRTVTLNYQVLRAMYFARRGHKLIEWRKFCDYIRNNLPYAKDLICYTREKKEM